PTAGRPGAIARPVPVSRLGDAGRRGDIRRGNRTPTDLSASTGLPRDMKFLHTSDWHVGRTVRGRSRDAEHIAALAQVLEHAKEQAVDCVLVAGDVFDTTAPTAESEKIVYDFFRELYGAGIPAVLIAGNHDHPKRFEALAPLLGGVRIHMVGEPKEPGAGGTF